MLKLIRLEERIVLDGAMVDTLADSQAVEFLGEALEALEAFAGEAFQQVAPVAGDTQQKSLDIILVSGDLPDIQQLVAAAQPGAYVHVFEAQANAAEVLQQTVDFAAEKQLPIGNLAIVTHGEAGSIQFGDTAVTNQQLQQHSDAWQALGQQMTADASLQVYGCEVASNADGVQLVNNLAALTGADVQASDDLTGTGGDWQLEVATAEVNQLLDGDVDYAHSLADPVVDMNTGATVDEDGMVQITNAMLSSSDTDAFDGPNEIAYVIDVEPAVGRILVDGQEIGQGQSFTQADIDAGLVFYQNNGDEVTSDSFLFTVTDPGAGSAPQESFDIVVNPVNDDPVLDLDLNENGRGYLGSFDEQGGPVPIANVAADGVLIDDVDSTEISQVTIVLVNPFDANNEILTANNLPSGGGVNANVTTQMDGSGNVTSITLTISGNATVAEYEQIIQDVTYENTSTTEATPERVINVTVTDAEGGTSDVSRTILFSQNTAPEIVAPADFTMDEDATENVVFSVSDADSNADPLRVTITAQNDGAASPSGVLALGSTAGLTIISDGTDGVLTIEGNQADLNAALATLDFTPEANYNGDATLTLFVDDLGNNGDTPNDANVTAGDPEDNLTATAVVNVTIDAVNDPPALTAPNDFNVEADEDTPLSIPGLTITDVDADPGELTVTLAVDFGTVMLGQTNGLTFVNGTQNGQATVTFTGSQTDLNAALQTVTYTGNLHANDLNNGGVETFTFTVNDEGNTGAPGDDQEATAEFQFNVNPINDAPTVMVPAAQTTDEDMSIAFSAANGIAITVDDLDANEDPDAASRDVRITLSVSDNGVLALNDTTGLTVVDGNNGDNTLVFEGTLAEVNAALDSLVYTPVEDFNGSDQLVVRIDDLSNYGDANDNDVLNEPEDNLFAIDTVDITINAVNDAPVIDLDGDDSSGVNGTGYQDTFREGDDPVGVVDDDVSIGDSEGDPIQSLELVITNVADAPQELLAFDPAALPTNVTANYDPATGTLTFTGEASAAEYAALLASVTYENTDDDPVGGDRDISVSVSDGTDTTTVNSTIAVVPVNDAPDITPPSNLFVEEETVTALNDVQISDVDAAGDVVRVTLTVDVGVLNVPDDNAGVTVTDNGTGTVVLEGSQADINTQLAGLNYTPPTNFAGDVDFTLNVNDLGNNGEGGPLEDTEMVTLTVGPVNDAPVVTVPGDQTVAEDTAVVITGVSVADVDAGNEDVQVVLSVGDGILNVDDNPNVQIAGNGTDEVTLTGSIDDINAVLAQITYQSDNNFNGTDQLTVAIDDLGNTGNGGPLQDSENVTINVTPVDDPPVIDPNGNGNVDPYENTFLEDGGPVSAVDPTALDISDPDGDLIGGITITLDQNLNPGDEELAIDVSTLPPGVSVVPASGNGTSLTITGNATPEEYEAILATLTYNNASDNPDQADRTISFTVTDENGTESDPVQSIIHIQPVNDAPTVTVPATLPDVNEDIEASVPGVSVADPDDNGQPLQVTVTADNGTLSVPTTPGVTVVGDDTGNLVLTGSEADINAALAGLTYQGNPDFAGTDNISVTVNDQGNTGIGGAQSANDSVAINVVPVNDPPAVVSNELNYQNGETVVIGPGALTAVDPDHDPDELTYTIVNPTDHGQIFLNGVSLGAGDTFTQADINNGLVTYENNGDPAQDDAFIFIVTDGDGATTFGQLSLVEQDAFLPDSVDYFDPANPVDPLLGPGPVGVSTPTPFDHTPPPLQPLFPQTDLFASAVAGLDTLSGGLEDRLLQGEYTDMQAGNLLQGTANHLGDGAPEIRYACSLLEVLDAGCRFDDAFNQPNAHLKVAQGHVVGNYLAGGYAEPTPNGAAAALDMAVDVFQTCGDPNQPPMAYTDSYERGVTGNEGECAEVQTQVPTQVPTQAASANAAPPVVNNAEDVSIFNTTQVVSEDAGLAGSQTVDAVEPSVGTAAANDVTIDAANSTAGDRPYDLNLVSEVVVLDE